MAVFTKIGEKLDQGVVAGKKSKVISRGRNLIARVARGAAKIIETSEEKKENDTVESKD